MNQTNQEASLAESKHALAAVAASQTSQQVIIGAEKDTINVIPLAGNGIGKREGYLVTKNTDGTFKVHSVSTNVTTLHATVCPTKKNDTITTCVVLSFNQDQTQVLSSKNVTFVDQVGTGFNVVTVSDLALMVPQN